MDYKWFVASSYRVVLIASLGHICTKKKTQPNWTTNFGCPERGIFQIHLVSLPILNNNPDLWAEVYRLTKDEKKRRKTKQKEEKKQEKGDTLDVSFVMYKWTDTRYDRISAFLISKLILIIVLGERFNRKLTCWSQHHYLIAWLYE